jgi:serine/threonine protein kinase
MRLTTGTRLGSYEIRGPLGAGGMADVYRARDARHDRVVAIKMFSHEKSSPEGVERFFREIRIAAQLTHPHILPLIDSGESDGVLFFVMPYIEGETLRERIKRGGWAARPGEPSHPSARDRRACLRAFSRCGPP